MRALTTQKSCAVGMRNAKLGNHLKGHVTPCNAAMTNKNPFKLQRECYTQATCLATLRKGRSTFLASHNATITVAKWGVTHEFFLAACDTTFVVLQFARKIASCNMALRWLPIVV